MAAVTSQMLAAAAAPVAVPLPAATSDFFTDAQWGMLRALMDAVMPSVVSDADDNEDAADAAAKTSGEAAPQLRVPEAELVAVYDSAKSRRLNDTFSNDAFRAYMAYRPSADEAFVDNCKRSLASVSRDARKRLSFVLDLLHTRMGSYMLTGYATPLTQQPVRVRQAIVESWRTSRLVTLQMLAKTFTVLGTKAFLQTSPLFKRLTGYTDAPADYEAAPTYDFKFLQFPPASSNDRDEEEPVTLETDVVIVGSGCGGAVCAKTLAEAGHSVLIVDKGYYFPPSQLPMSQDAACAHLYEANGFVAADDQAIVSLAGSCWGGGGAVNWSVSLPTPGYVRREWAEADGLPLFTSVRFQEALDRVGGVMGASDAHVRHNFANRVLLEGARRLGWHASAVPQNTGGEEHYCGRCHLGCGSSGKKGTNVTWLPKAVDAGARCIEGLEVEKVTFEGTGRGRKATGLVGWWISRDREGGVSGPAGERTTRRVVVKAKKVIVSCGSLRSPLLLQASGIKNRHLGYNLHLHPCNTVVGRWEEEVRPWEGGIITSYCTEFENLDGAGHGVKLETICSLPYTLLTAMPWQPGMAAKANLLKYSQLAGFIALTRDRDTGRVYADPHTGNPRLEYTPSAFDRAHTLEAVLGLAKICYVAGAREIHAILPGLEPFVRADGTVAASPTLSGINDPAFAAWLARARAAGNKPPVATYTSAHQMGTCRMSGAEDRGVVDPRGKVWGVDDLFVADASVLPSASGVNPMLTTMAVADWIAECVDLELRA